MQKALEREIVRHAKKVIRRHELNGWLARKHARNYEKRTGLTAILKPTAPPATWSLHPHFNPKYCIKHSKYLARVIWKKITEGNYEPVPAVEVSIPKPNGEFRQIMIFAIPDAALAKMFRSRLTIRNSKLFSANSYAYRFDRNLFDALLHVESAIKAEKVFLIQYDFRKYFDSISHRYLKTLIESERIFLTSAIEQQIIRAFLTHRYASKSDYPNNIFKEKDVGIPQGSSVSLWLANVAGHELDRDLEKRNGQFARYADDVISVVHSYEDALGIASTFENHCERAGLQINTLKSPGINVLCDGIEDEIRSIQHFDYLGHRFTKQGIFLTEKAIKRIKQRINRIIQIHLLHWPKKALFNRTRIGGASFDWDLVTCINEIRRYIYGGLKESDLNDLIFKNVRLPKVKGLMSFYVLISDPKQLRELDGWLLNSIRRALFERYKVLHLKFGIVQKAPNNSVLASGNWYSFAKIKCETRSPSFLRGWRGARKYYFRFGLGDVTPPTYYGY
jgi:RNA-directed DNA polymerase